MGEFNYFLMHKDIPITLLSFSDSGEIVHCSEKKINKERLPIICKEDNVSIQQWWRERAVPKSRDNLSEMLKAKGYSLPEDYLFCNLGLGLTDCYWINPMDSGLTWKDVSLFLNPFKDNSLKFSENNNNSLCYSPNGSLTGNIEKTWAIREKDRFLIKGNRTEKSAESLNEVFATMIHKSQGHSCSEYELMHISGKKYDYGCITKIFTSENAELISAFELLNKTGGSGNYYESLINGCVSFGMDKDRVIPELDYLILTDYIMSQVDRHFNNIGFLRNPDTLEFYGFAPIYDSGNSMYFDSIAPRSKNDLIYLSTKGFSDQLEHSLKLVRDASAVDLTKLPSVSDLKELYAKDSKENEEHVKDICYAYEKRIERCRNLQLGISADTPVYFHIPPQDKDLVNAFSGSYELDSLLRNCRKNYAYLVIQQEKGLDDLAEQTRQDIDKTMDAIIRLFRSKGFTEDDFFEYIRILNIEGIPTKDDLQKSGQDNRDNSDDFEIGG